MAGVQTNDFRDAHERPDAFPRIVEQAKEKLGDWLRTWYERGPTEQELQWAEDFVRDAAKRGGPRPPTLTEAVRGLELGASPVREREFGTMSVTRTRTDDSA